MIRLSFLDKLEILKKIIMSNSYLFVIFLSFIFIAIILLNLKKLDKNMLIASSIGIYIIIIMCIFIEYKQTFYGIIDYLVNDVFFNILFPSIATYALTIIISNIIIIKSIFNKKTASAIRKINILVYCFLSLILFLVLNFIKSNHIDVYSSLSVYSNKELFVLIELNMGIFMIWILSLGIYYLIKKKIAKDFSNEPVNVSLNEKIALEIEKEEIKEEKEVKPILNNNINISLNDLNKETSFQSFINKNIYQERQ